MDPTPPCPAVDAVIRRAADILLYRNDPRVHDLANRLHGVVRDGGLTVQDVEAAVRMMVVLDTEFRARETRSPGEPTDHTP
jgi:hypothetical protein